MKTVSLLKFPEGLVMPIRTIRGPQGGHYAPFEIPLMFRDHEDYDKIEVIVYELKKITTCKLNDLKSSKN